MKLVALLIPLIVVALAAPAAHEVTQLKGYYDFAQEFQMYSGYLTIQKTPLISVHYLFITSKNQPETDDLVVWSNGGPGCSSLIGTLPTYLRLPDRNRTSDCLPGFGQTLPGKQFSQLEQQCKYPVLRKPPRSRLFD